MINHNYKCIFIHINKCGGSSIDTLFNKEHCGHKTALDYKNCHPQKFDSYFKFSFTRNPWDKMVSFYHYHKKRGWDLNWDWNQANAPSFQEFIKIINDYSQEKQIAIFSGSLMTSKGMRMSNHIEWVCDESGNLLVDFIGKLENFQADFDYICDQIKMPRIELPHKNKSKHKHYTEYYDDETRQIVSEKYAKDIEYFGYKFGE
jgi:hypothetical protein